MTNNQSPRTHWSTWTLEIKVWKILAALIVVPILILWFRIVHQADEILALVRNDVVTVANGGRTWEGTFLNTNEKTMHDVAVTVDFLDSENRPIAKAEAEAAEAVRLRIYSVQWRMNGTAALMGPFREPWEFGYLMAELPQ